MKQETAIVAGDPPPAVVQVKMMESTQEHADIAIGAAAVGPVIAMMGFAVCGRPIAPGPNAPAIANGESEPLFRGEQPRFPSDIERVPACVHGHFDGAGRAESTFERRAGNDERIIIGVRGGH
jgi:hypothetical protein